MQKIVGYINVGMKHLLNVIMAILVISTFLQVVFRFVLENPLAWTEELARYCLIWLTFLGAAYTMSLKQHIVVEFFTNLFPPFGRKIFQMLAAIVSLLFFTLMIYQGIQLSLSAVSQLSPVLRLPMGAIYAVIPIGGLFLAINLISVIIHDMKKGDDAHDDSAV
ncbi:TRAP transporter small permease [Oceanobacillus halophilus]|uniref:TRAP transporter small permease n=1 Tax=Oceanobacillus halophilus TaxID=930130 RepID=A0A495A944_9BACI|nr:TRAP transporter small permease [Oceanobacillus halophilus]RKQ35821.1 TRAP transporter small permease [Oceanobacillus halophilus]